MKRALVIATMLLSAGSTSLLSAQESTQDSAQVDHLVSASQTLAAANAAIAHREPELAAYYKAQAVYFVELAEFAAHSVLTPEAVDSAMVSAAAAAASAWSSIGSTLEYEGLPPVDRGAQDSLPTAEPSIAAAPPLPPVAPPLPPAAPTVKTASAQLSAALGGAPKIFGTGSSNFKPWWTTGLYGSYRDNADDRFWSKGFGVDLTLYTFNQDQYRRFQETKEGHSDIRVSSVSPLLIVDLGVYGKLYPIPIEELRIPYISGSLCVSGTLGGSAHVEYRDSLDRPRSGIENTVGDVYLLNVAVGVGADYPIYNGIKIFADMHFALRLGLYSILKYEDDKILIGGLVPQMPIRVGVVVPFSMTAAR